MVLQSDVGVNVADFLRAGWIQLRAVPTMQQALQQFLCHKNPNLLSCN